jgi:hypothetical protein
VQITILRGEALLLTMVMATGCHKRVLSHCLCSQVRPTLAPQMNNFREAGTWLIDAHSKQHCAILSPIPKKMRRAETKAIAKPKCQLWNDCRGTMLHPKSWFHQKRTNICANSTQPSITKERKSTKRMHTHFSPNPQRSLTARSAAQAKKTSPRPNVQC